jgi:hypothetical protein
LFWRVKDEMTRFRHLYSDALAALMFPLQM